MSSHVPFIPSTAPFTPAQRAWLNGYFVGLLSTAHGSEAQAPQTPAKPLEPLLIGFGSQTGSAEGLAKRIGKESARHGFAARVAELNSIPVSELASTPRMLIVTSTWGDGDAPDNAAQFWTALRDSTTALPNLGYSVLALGDKNYSDFCGAGRKMDEKLAALGARSFLPRTDCDVDYEKPAAQWIENLWKALGSAMTVAPAEAVPKAAAYSKANPFPARLLTNRLLNQPGSAKETRHFEFSLEGSGLSYEPGDALGVLPRNCPELVREIIKIGNWNASAEIETKDGERMSFEEALFAKLDLRKPSSALLDALAKTEGCERLSELLTPEKKASLQMYLYEREVIDLLSEFQQFRPGEQELVEMLGKLQPRLYSISSSPRAFPSQVHLTVAIVRYETLNRKRKGLCSSFLADRAGESVPIFFQSSHGFRLPRDGNTPVIMVGPGTGIAPFRAFLHDRRATGAKGRNWLFFGDQKSSSDFLYRDELESLQRDGVLTRLDTAFSRDQSEKVYVQDRMLQSAAELYHWLEDGAHFYVCGDAKRMAKDVDAALHKVIELSGKSPADAAAYVPKLKEQKRYQRDVY